MSSYFPIPPTIWIEELSLNIYGSTTFLNVPNNRLKSKIFEKSDKNIIYLGLYSLSNNYWSLINVYTCRPYDFLEISRKNLNIDNESMIVLVPKKKNEFPKETNNLPKPDSLRIDNSPVAERSSLNFTINNNTTSYQGEYPFEMASLKKSSFLTFDILRSSLNKKVINYIIFMNILRDSSFQDDVIIKIFKPSDMKNNKKIIAKKNSYTLHKLSEIENFNEPNFYKTNQCSFIPIMFSIDLDSKQLSVEHTHPPTELFFGSNKFKAVKILKKQWM